MQNYLLTLAYVAILNSVYVIIALMVWYHIWVKKLGVEIPIEKKVAGLEKRQLYYSTTSPSILFDFFKKMLTKFDKEYWTNHCGLEAYLYLLFQRKLMKLSIIIAIGCMAVTFSTNLFIASDQQEWFERSTLNNKTFTPFTAWIHVLLVTFITIVTFWTVFDLREEARDLYKENEKEKCKVKDNEWLRARTLHVRGLLPKDRRGDMLKNEINLMLQPVHGRVLDVVVVPDFQRLFGLEMEKKDFEDLHVLVNAHGTPPACTRYCFKSLWTQRRGSFVETLKHIDEQIEQEIEKPFLSSGHAFVVLDSVKSLNHCLQHCKMTPTYAWKLAKVSFKESVANFFKTKLKKNTHQTFNQFVDEDVEIAQGHREKDLILVMSKASDPIDIVWRNMGGVRGVYLFRKIFFSMVGLFLVLFLSTPAAIFSALKTTEWFNLVDMTTKVSKDSFLGSLMITIFPPLVIILINNILLYMIYYSAYWEKRVTHSKYQFSIFNKAYVYLMLNMLIIPAVTLTTYHQTSIIQVFRANGYNPIAVLAQIYSGDSGVFFVSMLIQNSCLSVCASLVRGGEISYAFFSPWLAHYRRKYTHDSQSWRRKEGEVFLYGYYYAQNLIIITIVLVFATTVPMISIAGFLFFGLRHLIDTYNILTVNRKEIESSSSMFRKVLLNFQVGILLLQSGMLAYLAMNQFYQCAAFIGTVLLCSSFVIILTNKSLFDISQQDQAIFNDTKVTALESEIGDSSDQDAQLYVPIMNWRQEYSHPLTLTGDRTFEQVDSTIGDCQKKKELEIEIQTSKDKELKQMIFAGHLSPKHNRASARNSNASFSSNSKREKSFYQTHPSQVVSKEAELFQMNPFADNITQKQASKNEANAMLIQQEYPNNACFNDNEIGLRAEAAQKTMHATSTHYNTSGSGTDGTSTGNRR